MSAIISPCGVYRYRLERKIGDIGPTAVFIMVNPSTADAAHDDATIRKCIGFAQRLEAERLVVGNLFAYRATDVRALRKTRDPVGPENDAHLREMLFAADWVIAAWGSLNKLPEALRQRWKDVVRFVDENNDTIRCIGTCNDGHPKHPLMVGYDAPLVAWSVPWFPNRRPPQAEGKPDA